jgi:hypothetical protein
MLSIVILEIINNLFHINKDFKYCFYSILMVYLLLINKPKNGNIMLSINKNKNRNRNNKEIYLLVYYRNIYLN